MASTTRLLAVGLLLAAGWPLCLHAQDAERGLLGYWDFEEGQGAVLHDRSGNGNDGTISGGATWVEGRRGKALSFNGSDAMVEIPRRPTLDLAGDITLMAWIRTRSDDARDRLIFGDGASLAVQRNFNLELDRGTPFIEHGNGSETETITPILRFDGAWAHLAIVAEFPRYYLYCDGRLVRTGEMAFPVMPTPGGKRYIGGWWAGKFKGEIDEVRLYGRALAEREVLAQYEGRAVAPAAAVQVTPHWQNAGSVVAAELTCRNLPADAAAAEVAVFKAGSDTPLEQHRLPLTLTRPASERAVATATFSAAHFRRGTYRLRALLRDAAGRQIASAEAEFAYAARPAWLGSKLGLKRRVLPPYTPVEVEDGKGATAGQVSAKVWGRSYDFAGGLLGQVRSREASLLAAPLRLVARRAGQEVAWQSDPPQLATHSATQALVRQRSRDGALALQVEGTLEFDGFCRFACRLEAGEALDLDELRLEAPLLPTVARYLYTWPTSYGGQGYSGALQGAQASEFKPIVWLGDEARGLSFFWESDQGWQPADAAKAIEVVPQADRVVLRFNLAGKPLALAPGGALVYTFALQATPLKPVARDGWDNRFVGAPWYGYDYDLLTRQIEGKPALEHLQQRGCRTLIAGNWTQLITYPWPTGREREFKALVDACHHHGMRLVPYLGYQVCEAAPEYPFFRDDIVKLPLQANPDKYPGTEPLMVDTVCLRSVWQDCLVYNVARMLDEYGIDGVYLDSTCMPFACVNERHGCGYRRADGSLAPTYPVFAVRELFRRLYTVVTEHRPEGMVDAHVFDCMNSAALAFSTSYWNGEQLTPADPPLAGLPLDRFRTEMMGVNWGVPAEFLHYRLGDYAKCHALALLHDVPVRCWAQDLELTASVWRVADSFGRKEARFLPYWSNATAVEVTPASACASLYVHPRNGVLAIVSNLAASEARVTLRLNLAALGLRGAGLVATDALSGKALALQDGGIEVPLGPSGWTYVWVRQGAE